MGILGGISTLILMQLWDSYDWESNEVTKAMKDEWDKIGFAPSTTMYVAIFVGLVAWAIAIIAAVGYLKMKRIQGRALGNLFALLAIVAAYLEVTAMSEMSFGILSFLSFIYPVLTLFLINTTFKDDLVR